MSAAGSPPVPAIHGHQPGWVTPARCVFASRPGHVAPRRCFCRAAVCMAVCSGSDAAISAEGNTGQEQVWLPRFKSGSGRWALTLTSRNGIEIASIDATAPRGKCHCSVSLLPLPHLPGSPRSLSLPCACRATPARSGGRGADTTGSRVFVRVPSVRAGVSVRRGPGCVVRCVAFFRRLSVVM